MELSHQKQPENEVQQSPKKTATHKEGKWKEKHVYVHAQEAKKQVSGKETENKAKQQRKTRHSIAVFFEGQEYVA